jgi:isoleucyl-tRNA synthetase
MFGVATADASFTRIEEEVRRYWRRHGIPEAARAASGRTGQPFLVYQQPLKVAGQDQSDRIRLLAITDLLVRYRTMRGAAVSWQAGWDCHGLAVEVEVERALGTDGAGYDLAQFSEACRRLALEGIEQGEALAERLGAWLGPDNVFVTLTPQAVSAVWGVLKRLWEAGLLSRERRVVPVCPRCATPLSTQESVRRTVEAETHSVWVRLPWQGEPNTYFLFWTPVPWTLVGMVALAAHPDASYVLVEPVEREEQSPGRLLLAEDVLNRSWQGRFRILRKLDGRALKGARYHPPFTFQPTGGGGDRVVLSTDTPVDRGSGLFPVTPAFDGPSLALARRHDLPEPQLLDRWGSLDASVTPWRGLSPLDAEPYVVEDLKARGLVVEKLTTTASRALCPYCETPLLPLARTVWLLATGSGPWLLSRDRVWGTTLPVWACGGCGEELFVAGVDDLGHRAGRDANQIDPHRPAVDQITLPCASCGGVMQRVPDVVDPGFEISVLPWATSSRPGPADLAIGLGDRDTGWLGDLNEIVALLRQTLAWEQAANLADGGRDALPLDIEGSPAEPLRWAAYTGSTPEEAEEEFLRPLWNLVLSLRGGHHSAPSQGMQVGTHNQLMERWLRARLCQAIEGVTEALEAPDPRRAAQELAALVLEIGNCYVPFGPGAQPEIVETLARLLAPFVPHLAEAAYRLTSGRMGQSVHLIGWPDPEPLWEDKLLLARMAQVQRLAALGKVARAGVNVAAGQELHQAIISMSEELAVEPLVSFQMLLAHVLHVAKVRFASDITEWVVWRLTLERQQSVERDIAQEEIETALAGLVPTQAAPLASQLRAGLSVGLEVAGQAITLLPDEVRVSAHPRSGWTVAFDAEQVVVLKVG